VNAIFVPNSKGSLLETYLVNLGKYFSPHGTASGKAETSIASLYTPKTNIHTISRYLPDSIHRFTPYINYGEFGAKGISIETIKERSDKWLKLLGEDIQKKGYEMLNLIDKGQYLAKTRMEAWKSLQIHDDTPPSNFASTSTQIAPENSNDWDQICENVLGHTFCFWRDLLRRIFLKRSEDIIQSSFLPLLQLPSKLLAPLLANSSKQEIEINLGKYVWSSEEEKNPSVNLNLGNLNTNPLSTAATPTKKRTEISNRSMGFTPAVVQVQDLFDAQLVAIKTDIDFLFIFPVRKTKDSQDPYFFASDSLHLKKALQRAFVDTIYEFKTELTKMLQEIRDNLDGIDPEAVYERNVIYDRMLLLGRIARSIASRTKSQSSILQVTSSPFQSSASTMRKGSTLTTTPLTSLSTKSLQRSETDLVLEKLQQAFTDVYIESHSEWVHWLADVFASLIQEGLMKADWRETAKRFTVWEAVTVEEEGEKSENPALIKLPSQVSAFITHSFFALTEEIHRRCGHTLDKNVVKLLVIELSEKILPIFEEFVQSKNEQLSDKGAVQLLFDFQFIYKVIKGSWDQLKQIEYQERYQRILSQIKEKIDPIDLAIYENYVQRNVDRFYVRTSILYGVITALNDPIIETKKAPSLKEQHNLLSIAPTAKRFSFLPISDSLPTLNLNAPKTLIDQISPSVNHLHSSSPFDLRTLKINSQHSLSSSAPQYQMMASSSTLSPQQSTSTAISQPLRITRQSIKIDLTSESNYAKQKRQQQDAAIEQLSLQRGTKFLRGVTENLWSGFGVFAGQENVSALDNKK